MLANDQWVCQETYMQAAPPGVHPDQTHSVTDVDVHQPIIPAACFSVLYLQPQVQTQVSQFG